MRRREFLQRAATGLPVAAAAAQSRVDGQTLSSISLPKPQMQGGKPFLQTVSERRTERNISEEKLSPQVLSNLLWAAWGVNRPATKGRTAPSARNIQEIDVYVFLAQGVYRYEAFGHGLQPVLGGDHREKAGTQPGVGKAPVNMIYVADFERYGANASGDTSRQMVWSSAHAGFIGQNVHLFAASEGLGAWFRASLDTSAVAALLKLRPAQKVLYGQTVGYPSRRT
jgi:nitroreductase